ncbi:MAG: putative collagen-binding domain of a collagenase, partial [Phycisphaerales bacterium]|nr:putative collagen-binding domain of a collagenase [Phycisphaerales bacterium]
TLAYLPAGGQLNLHPNRLPSTTKPQWFNPRTGEYQQATRTTAPNQFTAPTTEDWLWLATN